MLKLLLALPLCAPLAAAETPSDQGDDPVAKSVVRIFTTVRKPDYLQPWQMAPQESLSGSGCVIEGGRILTNAHVVADHVFVEVRKAGDAKKYAAKVEFIANDSELALLNVEDPSFHHGTKPLALGVLPMRREKVSVYGFPDGGDDLSVTEGIVSRVEVTEYSHSGRSMLTIQTDAAINPGNSGGPMIKDGRLAGISFQMQTEAQNIGYAVPAPVIERFLTDVKDGRYDGVPDLGVRYESVENAAKRAYLGLEPGATGVLVSTVAYGSSGWGLLRKGDVLTAIDGLAIYDDGTVHFRRNERLLMNHFIDRHQVGEKAVLGVLRGGRALTVPVPLKVFDNLVAGPSYGNRPSYFVFAGLVFTPLSWNYLATWDYNEVPTDLKVYLEFGLPTAERRKAIVLAHVLPDAVNEGYHEYRNQVIGSVNGRPIGSMRDLIEAFRHPRGGTHVVETDPSVDQSGFTFVLDAQRAERANEDIIKRYNLPADRSADLR
ncbi:MAG: trypsin-like peptidase domain-containing protein [Elusimicrobia bacterium]|nr:trypsin-like peptidase domain-containing protein [Elusimicrobiota bacterium]